MPTVTPPGTRTRTRTVPVLLASAYTTENTSSIQHQFYFLLSLIFFFFCFHFCPAKNKALFRGSVEQLGLRKNGKQSTSPGLTVIQASMHPEILDSSQPEQLFRRSPRAKANLLPKLVQHTCTPHHSYSHVPPVTRPSPYKNGLICKRPTERFVTRGQYVYSPAWLKKKIVTMRLEDFIWIE